MFERCLADVRSEYLTGLGLDEVRVGCSDLARAPAPIEPSGARYFLYSDDLRGLREQRLIEIGWEPPEIEDGSPGPKQEMSICDPDRRFLAIAQID